MSNARNLANLLGTGTQIKTDKVADEVFQANDSLIINGDMAVAQRNSSSAVAAAGAYATVDRFTFYESTDGAYTSEQSSEAPDGFSNSVKLTVTTADTSLASNQYAEFFTPLEAQNLQHLNYGTASAKNLTLSFWVRSNKTGTYSAVLEKHDNTRYHFVKEYTIDTADTWEYKTISIKPDSNIKGSNGAFNNDNGLGLRVTWWLAGGSNFTGATDNTWSSDTSDFATTNHVNWMDSIGNNFYLTGAKLEVGDTATPFQHLSYGDNLQQCQRYFYKTLENIWFYRLNGSTEYGRLNQSFPVEMRASPTATFSITGTASPTGTQYLSRQQMGLFVNSPSTTCAANSGATFDAEL